MNLIKKQKEGKKVCHILAYNLGYIWLLATCTLLSTAMWEEQKGQSGQPWWLYHNNFQYSSGESYMALSFATGHRKFSKVI